MSCIFLEFSFHKKTNWQGLIISAIIKADLSIKTGLFDLFYIFHCKINPLMKPGAIQVEGEVKLFCLDAKRKQRQWLTLSFFAVGLWVWARDRNSLYRHCVCNCWNYSTVERFVHCHQGKPRQQKHTHSGKMSTWEGSFSPKNALLGFQR